LTQKDLHERVRRLAAAALDRKAQDVVALDVSGVTSFADAFLIATGTSDRHARSVADAVREVAKAEGEVLGVEGYDEGRWILIDLGDIVVHVFQGEARSHYDLERLWRDAAAIDLSGLQGPTRREASV
jgi:ribosome-associated protein